MARSREQRLLAFRLLSGKLVSEAIMNNTRIQCFPASQARPARKLAGSSNHKRPNQPIRFLAGPCRNRPIRFAMPSILDIALNLDRTAGWLRRITERAIRTRCSEAFIDHEANRIHRPPIYCLPLRRQKNLRVYFTVESHAILVRGYFYDIVGEPLDDFDGGIIITTPDLNRVYPLILDLIPPDEP